LIGEVFIVLYFLIFLSGFIDSIAGGGGLISVPAYQATLSDASLVLGSNKFSAVFGTAASAFKFIKSKKFHREAAAVSVVFSLIGSWLGARAALAVPTYVTRLIIIILTPFIAVFILTKKDFGADKKYSLKKILLLTAPISFLTGAYDGFFGPGTGAFLAICFTSIVGFDIITASGNARIANFASNFAAAITFIASGKIDYRVAAPCAVISALGSFLGSRLAVKNGVKIIRPIFIVVLTALLATCVFQLLK
jgi:uncharacterized membrane protein YfcA